MGVARRQEVRPYFCMQAEMYRWKLAERRPALLFITVILTTPTVCHVLPIEPTTWPLEPDCKQGLQNVTICACDPQCAQYADCCRSSTYFVPEKQRLGASPFTCNNLFGNEMYVMTRCPPDWTDNDTRNRCQHPDGSYRDPLLDAPVTSFSTNITYQNWHCAYCHGDLDAATTAIWDASFTCMGSYRTISLSDETLAEHLSFNPLTSSWDMNISLSTFDMKPSMSTPAYTPRGKDNNTQEMHSNCFLRFTAPAMELPARRFNSDVTSTCSERWEDNGVKTHCEAYTARVCSGFSTYRNHHCLLCNDVVVPQPCFVLAGPAFPGSFVSIAAAIPPSFTVLLDWRRLKRGVCASSEIYDPLACVCRKVFM
uniref:Class B secretin-like G-protein coupled receptor n=1 Tax=Coptotermes formosanus TaxID=36987 RepID=R4UVT5_COPFO|nr:class B secretin-like G-protein coupled receptor [Coptotermes formosanus]